MSDDIEMKLGPVNKLEKWNKTTSKMFDDDVMLGNCDVIDIFSDLRLIWSNLEVEFRMHNL